MTEEQSNTNNLHNTRSQKNKKRGRSKIRLVLGIILILVAVGLLAINPIKNHLIAQRTENNTVRNVTRDQIVENNQANVSFDWSNITAIDAADVLASSINPKDLPVIGGLAIPDLKMNLPIYRGATPEGMFYGAGTLYPDQVMGESNYSIASHHSIHKDLLFAPLLNAEIGQTVYMTDLDKIYVYETNVVDTVAPERVDVTYPTETPTLTMITCDSSLINRVIVQATLVDVVDVNDATPEMLEAFEIDQTVPE